VPKNKALVLASALFLSNPKEQYVIPHKREVHFLGLIKNNKFEKYKAPKTHEMLKQRFLFVGIFFKKSSLIVIITSF